MNDGVKGGVITVARKGLVAMARTVGAVLIIVAVVLWLVFPYENPGFFGVNQVLNWVLVSVLAGGGIFLLTWRPKLAPRSQRLGR